MIWGRGPGGMDAGSTVPALHPQLQIKEGASQDWELW